MNDTQVNVRNLTEFNVGFAAKTGEKRDIVFKPGRVVSVSEQEIRHQIDNDNPLFIGVDPDRKILGFHADLYIESRDLRIELGLETEDKPQQLLDMDGIVVFFNTPSLQKFKRGLSHTIVSNADFQLMKKAINENYVTDHSRIGLALEYAKSNCSIF